MKIIVGYDGSNVAKEAVAPQCDGHFIPHRVPQVKAKMFDRDMV